VIPHRQTETANQTLNYLPKEVKKIIVNDNGRGANWARNEGFKAVNTEFVLFSDNDIKWRPNALESLYMTLQEHPEASYAYGAYLMGGNIYCNVEFNPDWLKLSNYISTMSLIRTKDFPGFDENIDRFQDWDLWLTMLEDDKVGVYCGEVIFDTDVKDGITHNSKISIEEAYKKIKEKHKI
jgi:glycosyltransferase involved in cell wall biosynthesis